MQSNFGGGARIKVIGVDNCFFGLDKARAKKRAELATKAVLSLSLLNIPPKGALFNVSDGNDISLSELKEIG